MDKLYTKVPCKNCGKLILNISNRRFCSDYCRNHFYYINNKDKKMKKIKEWKKKNPEKVKKHYKNWIEKNRYKWNLYQKKKAKEYYHKDIESSREYQRKRYNDKKEGV